MRRAKITKEDYEALQDFKDYMWDTIRLLKVQEWLKKYKLEIIRTSKAAAGIYPTAYYFHYYIVHSDYSNFGRNELSHILSDSPISQLELFRDNTIVFSKDTTADPPYYLTSIIHYSDCRL